MSNQPAQIVVIGGYNRDLSLSVDRFPGPGETCLSTGRMDSPGGKGSNQAIQAAACGAATAMVAALGGDGAADEALSLWSGYRIDTKAVVRLAHVPTGMAMILVDDRGENLIIVDSGANGHLSEPHVAAAEGLISDARLILAQMETPVPATVAAFRLARRYGVATLLNAAPASATLDPQLMALTDILCVNETEGAALCGQTAPEAIGDHLLTAGPAIVILTLGAEGAVLFQKGRSPLRAPAPKVTAIDTTGAGDAFIGAFAARWIKDQDPSDALNFAIAAGALACTRRGAAASFGDLNEIEQLTRREPEPL